MHDTPGSAIPQAPTPDDAPIASWAECRMLAAAVGVREAARRLGLSVDAALKRSQREKWFADPLVKKAAQSTPRSNVITPSSQSGEMGAHALAAELTGLSGRGRLASLRTAVATLENASRRAKKRPREVLAEAHEVKAMTGTCALAADWAKSSPVARMSLQVAGAASITMEIGGTEQRVEIASFEDMNRDSQSGESPVVETVMEIEGQKG